MANYTREEISTSDGCKIVSHIYAPAGEPAGSVLIVPGVGLTQQYYAALATWLAAQGFLTATFDYRGMGKSRTGSLRGFQATILDWAQLDCSAMVNTLSSRLPDKPLFWIGHSMGGQILAFVRNQEKISKVITIAAGSGYWLENAPRLKYRVWFLWFLAAPLATAICGYFPGKRLHMVGDLPKGVIRQWRRWCLNPDYAAGAEGDAARALYAAVSIPITSLSFTDDEYMSARNIEALHHLYINADKKMLRIHPADIHMKQIGHFGFFRQKYENTLWRQYLLPELV